MKKTVLTFLTLLTISTSVIAQVNIPDANFKTYLVSNSLINTNGDTEIQVSEATIFTGEIDCTSLGVADLTGISEFTNLIELKCGNNDLTALDLSNNTALTKLSCSLNSLTTLDLSNNPALIQLWSNGNDLTVLDLSNNPDLIYLGCQGNDLTALNLSNNTALTLLFCHNNDLTNLNVANGNNTIVSVFNATGNPNLTCIQVDNIAWSTTNWTINIDATASFSTNCSLAINNLIFKNISIYPNPTTGVVNFNFVEQIETITVYNLLGTKVNYFTNTNSINMATLPNGVYMLTVMTVSGKIITKKVIKK